MKTSSKASKDVRYYEGARNEHQEKVLEGVAIWASYYRANIHRFVEDYFHIQLKLFQIFLLYMMNVCSTFVFIACRGRLYKHAGVWRIDTARPPFSFGGDCYSNWKKEYFFNGRATLHNQQI